MASRARRPSHGLRAALVVGALWCLPQDGGADPTLVGATLPTAPSVAPGGVPPAPETPLSLASERWIQGDAAGTVIALTPWLDSKRGPYGRERDAGHLLMGLAQKKLGNHNLASAHFYRVRRSGRVLSPWGAWFEALMDHERGRHAVAVRECRAYQSAWPAGPHAGECQLLIGEAYSAMGNRGAAIGAFRTYLSDHPDTPREEEIRVEIALAVSRTSPKEGIRLWHGLMLNHSFPSTDLAARTELKRLAEAGHDTALPDDNDTRMRRARALRRSGKLEEAWALFKELKADAAEDPAVAAWIEDSESTYAWGTRQYDHYAAQAELVYAEEPSSGLAWNIFRAWGRDGEWAKAAAWGRKGLEVHGKTGKWRYARDDVAWAAMLAGEYADAAERFGGLEGGGAEGRKAGFYKAFSLYRGGSHDEAIEAFDTVIERGGHHRAAGHYWRGKAYKEKGESVLAMADAVKAMSEDRTGWYAMLMADPDKTDRSADGWLIHDGRWRGPLPTELAAQPRLPVRTADASALFGTGAAELVGTSSPSPAGPATANPFASLTWGLLQAGATQPSTPSFAAGRTVPVAGIRVPDGYAPSVWFAPEAARKGLYHFAEANKELWPDLPAAHDLARGGLHVEAARLVYAAYEEWAGVRKSGAGEDERKRAIARVSPPGGWRPLFLYVRDHYHAARHCTGLSRGAKSEEERLAAMRLAYPVVHGRDLWGHAQRYNVDPYMMMGLMRQESTYRNTALSRVGATGLVQVMPRTGAKVAALMGETRYSPGDLEDPFVNLRYGVFYMSRLLDRFDGAFPLAVASYNGGPHNMSRWYKPWRDRIEMDALVEQIQYDETRDYVKKVSGYYARYVAYYEPHGARVVVPAEPSGDDPTVIDF